MPEIDKYKKEQEIGNLGNSRPQNLFVNLSVKNMGISVHKKEWELSLNAELSRFSTGRVRNMGTKGKKKKIFKSTRWTVRDGKQPQEKPRDWRCPSR